MLGFSWMYSIPYTKLFKLLSRNSESWKCLRSCQHKKLLGFIGIGMIMAVILIHSSDHIFSCARVISVTGAVHCRRWFPARSGHTRTIIGPSNHRPETTDQRPQTRDHRPATTDRRQTSISSQRRTLCLYSEWRVSPEACLSDVCNECTACRAGKVGPYLFCGVVSVFDSSKSSSTCTYEDTQNFGVLDYLRGFTYWLFSDTW